MPPENLTNRKFGKLTVTRQAPPSGARKRVCWYCDCDCGKKDIIKRRDDLISPRSAKSCGCWTSELKSKGKTKHGMCNLQEYRIWAGIITRCENKNCDRYSSYGGRGISVCQRWRESFENFYKDMGSRPSEKHSIERERNDGNYCPENCKWVTDEEQANNKRNNKYVTYNGKTQTVPQWARELKIHVQTLYSRIKNPNWTTEQALTVPTRKNKR